MNNTHILMDYDNVYITLDKNYVRVDHENLRTDIVTKLQEKFNEDKVCETKLFLDFKNIQLTEDEFNVFKNNHVELKHVYSGKNASDVYLMLEIMKTLILDKEINKFIVISADSDMLPIVNEIKRQRKEVVVVYFSMNTDEEYIKYIKTIADDCFSIEELFDLKPHKDVDFEYFENNRKNILEFINNDIIQVFNGYDKFNTKTKTKIKSGVYGKKDLRKLIESHRLIVKNDISLIIDKLFELEILYESDGIDGSTYKKVLLNQNYLKSNDIILENTITEENYKNWYPDT